MRTYVLFLMAMAVTLGACSDSKDPVSSDDVGPGIVAMQPAPGTSYISADQPFTAEFSEAMEISTVEAAYRVVSDGDTVLGRYSWNDSATVMSFEPTSPLASGQRVDIQWGPGMRNRRGQSLVTEDGLAQRGFSFSCQVYAAPTDYESNGQRIFVSGVSASGEPITFTMGDGFPSSRMPGFGAATGRWSNTTRFGGMMGGGMMMGGYGMSCATCHGPEGTGGRYLAMGTVETPNITYGELTEATDEDGHEHSPYTDETLLRAITEGVGSDGEPLNAFMPRWQMTQADQQDLLEFLKSL